jgi:hypothetical protein
MKINAPDLTKQPPRSPRVRLGGYAIAARMLDKCRAHLIGKGGDYHFNCPLDKQFLSFAGIDAMKLKKEAAKGRGDGEMLNWIQANAKHKRTAPEIAAWSALQDQRGATDVDTRAFFNDYQSKVAPKRKDVASWFDLLDIDDYVSFGGKA